ncbi:MAG TPA: trypsin-like serine protease, partial [Polyangiaceae bacterium]
MRSVIAARLLAAIGCLLAAACVVGRDAGEQEPAARSSSAITHGSADTGDAAVVAIVASSGVMACSGTVVAPHIVLTAAHCVLPEVIDGARVVVGSSVASPTATIPVAHAVAHPQFDPVALTNDVAILVLSGAAPVSPVPFGTAPPAVGASVALAGWGVTAEDAGDSGEKRQGTGVVGSVDANTFGVGSVPSQPCEGDSGGPAFVTASGVTSVEGITSQGDAACVAGATYTRVDAYVASFIAPTMAQYS